MEDGYSEQSNGTLRVNTQLDDDTLASLRFLRKELGGFSIAETVKYSLVVVARLLKEKKSQEGSKMKALLESDFIGSGEGSVGGFVSQLQGLPVLAGSMT